MAKPTLFYTDVYDNVALRHGRLRELPGSKADAAPRRSRPPGRSAQAQRMMTATDVHRASDHWSGAACKALALFPIAGQRPVARSLVA